MVSSPALITSLILINTLVLLQVVHVYGRIDLRLIRERDLSSQQPCHSCLTSSSSSAVVTEDEDTDDDVIDEELTDDVMSQKRGSFASNSIARRPDDEDLTRYEGTGEKLNGGGNLEITKVEKYPRTPERDTFESNTKQALRRYREWRQENGYGQVLRSRWGRGRRSNLEKDGVRSRSKRSVVGLLEIELPSGEDMNVDEKNVLDSYLTWRENHGYGTLAGRWG
jgi:hypothetical protein